MVLKQVLKICTVVAALFAVGCNAHIPRGLLKGDKAEFYGKEVSGQSLYFLNGAAQAKDRKVSIEYIDGLCAAYPGRGSPSRSTFKQVVTTADLNNDGRIDHIEAYIKQKEVLAELDPENCAWDLQEKCYDRWEAEGYCRVAENK